MTSQMASSTIAYTKYCERRERETKGERRERKKREGRKEGRGRERMSKRLSKLQRVKKKNSLVFKRLSRTSVFHSRLSSSLSSFLSFLFLSFLPAIQRVR